MSDLQIHPASYRDPAGFVYQVNDTLYRQVNQSGRADFDLLNSSGLYEVLVRNGQLVQHETIEQNIRNDADCYVNLRISPVPFISYPYEWCFAQLRDAALLTITVAKQALDHGMILKDASPFNIQFVCGKPVFIDTLSFKKYDAAKPWVAYRQFCQSFLFPLLLAHYNRFPAQQLMTVYPEGIPVTYIASMLPARSRFSLGVWLHVLLQKNISERKTDTGRKISFNQNKMLQLLSNLESTIKNLRAGYSASAGHWHNYYDETILSKEYLIAKEEIFIDLLRDASYQSALDMGANDGFFSRLIAGSGTHTVAIDSDETCISRLYKSGESQILPLVLDIAVPSPAIGLNNKERYSFLQRGPFELVAALAVIHHLFFTRNIPLTRIAELLASLTSRVLIVEFVPVEDEKVKILLAQNAVTHAGYTHEHFETAMAGSFTMDKKTIIPGSNRILYRYYRKTHQS